MYAKFTVKKSKRTQVDAINQRKHPLEDNELSEITKEEILFWARKLNKTPSELFTLSQTKLEEYLQEAQEQCLREQQHIQRFQKWKILADLKIRLMKPHYRLRGGGPSREDCRSTLWQILGQAAQQIEQLYARDSATAITSNSSSGALCVCRRTNDPTAETAASSALPTTVAVNEAAENENVEVEPANPSTLNEASSSPSPTRTCPPCRCLTQASIAAETNMQSNSCTPDTPARTRYNANSTYNSTELSSMHNIANSRVLSNYSRCPDRRPENPCTPSPNPYDATRLRYATNPNYVRRDPRRIDFSTPVENTADSSYLASMSRSINLDTPTRSQNMSQCTPSAQAQISNRYRTSGRNMAYSSLTPMSQSINANDDSWNAEQSAVRPQQAQNAQQYSSLAPMSQSINIANDSADASNAPCNSAVPMNERDNRRNMQSAQCSDLFLSQSVNVRNDGCMCDHCRQSFNATQASSFRPNPVTASTPNSQWQMNNGVNSRNMQSVNCSDLFLSQSVNVPNDSCDNSDQRAQSRTGYNRMLAASSASRQRQPSNRARSRQFDSSLEPISRSINVIDSCYNSDGSTFHPHPAMASSPQPHPITGAQRTFRPYSDYTMDYSRARSNNTGGNYYTPQQAIAGRQDMQRMQHISLTPNSRSINIPADSWDRNPCSITANSRSINIPADSWDRNPCSITPNSRSINVPADSWDRNQNSGRRQQQQVQFQNRAQTQRQTYSLEPMSRSINVVDSCYNSDGSTFHPHPAMGSTPQPNALTGAQRTFRPYSDYTMDFSRGRSNGNASNLYSTLPQECDARDCNCACNCISMLRSQQEQNSATAGQNTTSLTPQSQSINITDDSCNTTASGSPAPAEANNGPENVSDLFLSESINIEQSSTAPEQNQNESTTGSTGAAGDSARSAGGLQQMTYEDESDDTSTLEELSSRAEIMNFREFMRHRY